MRAAALACALLVIGAVASCGTSSTNGHGGGSGAPTRPSASPPQPTISNPLPPTAPLKVPSGFVGTWWGHSRNMVVMHDGTVLLDFRVYINCTPTRTTECDRTRGHRIYDGGRIVAHVTRVIDKTTMIMTVSATSAPDFVPPGPVRIGHDLTHDALAIFGGRLSGDPFCGKGSPPGYCGA